MPSSTDDQNGFEKPFIVLMSEIKIKPSYEELEAEIDALKKKNAVLEAAALNH